MTNVRLLHYTVSRVQRAAASFSYSVLRKEKQKPKKNLLWNQVSQSNKNIYRITEQENCIYTATKQSNHSVLANAHCDFVFAD